MTTEKPIELKVGQVFRDTHTEARIEITGIDGESCGLDRDLDYLYTDSDKEVQLVRRVTTFLYWLERGEIVLFKDAP